MVWTLRSPPVKRDILFQNYTYLELTYRVLTSFGPLTWWTGIVGGGI